MLVKIIRKLSVCMFAFVLFPILSEMHAYGESLKYLDSKSEWIELKEVMTIQPHSLPINNSRKAIEYAKEFGLLKKSNIAALEAKGYSDWVVIVTRDYVKESLIEIDASHKRGDLSLGESKNKSEDVVERGDVWRVQLQSMGKDPSYHCMLEISHKGKLIKELECNLQTNSKGES